MTKDQRSLLIFLETRAVDYGRKVNIKHMNDGDMAIAKQWNQDGFLLFGRRKSTMIQSDPTVPSNRSTHLVDLSDDAWNLAHQERRARNARMVKRHGELLKGDQNAT